MAEHTITLTYDDQQWRAIEAEARRRGKKPRQYCWECPLEVAMVQKSATTKKG